MSQRADRELDRLLHIARPEVSRDFTDDVMSRIAATDDPMPIAPAIIFPFRARGSSAFLAPPPPSLFVRTAIVTAPLVAMLALVFVLATTLFTDKGTERRRGPDDSSAVRPGGPAGDLAAEVKRLEGELERSRTALNAAEPHDMEGKRRCSMCHDVARLASISLPNVNEQRGGIEDRLEVVAFVDLEAPSGPAMMQAIETMALKFSDKVVIEIRNPRTGNAARASLAAAQEGAYWQMVECLAEYGTGATGIDTCAVDAKLDRIALEQTMFSTVITAALDDDRERARTAGVAGPAIVIGDRVFSGPRAHVDAREFVNAALARRTL